MITHVLRASFRYIVTGSRTRRPTSRRREAYVTDLQVPEEFPGFYDAFAIGLSYTSRLHQDNLPPPPKNWREMQSHPQKGFLDAANREISELQGKETFKYVERPKGTQIVPLLWVFVYKFDKDGFLVKYKSRLCVRGDKQRLTLKDTYAATLTAKVFRAMMAITAAFDLETNQYDVQNAFPHCDLDEVVYYECPEGFGQTGMCILLLKALYGLRRAPRLWQQKLISRLNQLGLRQVADESCLFVSQALILIFFVDDIITMFHREFRSQAIALKTALTEPFDIKDLGELKWFLGVRVVRDRPNRKLWLCQDSYVD